MNELLGSWPGAPLAAAGTACSRVGEAVGDEHATDGFLAGLFWWSLAQSGYVRQLGRELGAQSDPEGGARAIVVTHAEGTRHDLLVLDPRYRGEPEGMTIDVGRLNDAVKEVPFDETVLNSLVLRSDLGQALTAGTLAQARNELAANREFGIAVAALPREMDTCATSPGVTIVDDAPSVVATLGTFVTKPGDVRRLLATTADHAVTNFPQLTINGQRFTPEHRHSPSDSCLIEVDASVIHGGTRRGLAGPLRGIPPTQYTVATFDGGFSGPTPTKIQSFDLAIMDPQADEMCRVYTDPDTAPGDSGAALIDDHDRIIGFAWRRSRYDATPQYSAWIWAEQVYLAQNLFGATSPA